MPRQQGAVVSAPATYGGYTEQQLTADPRLVQTLGASGLRKWNARPNQGGGGATAGGNAVASGPAPVPRQATPPPPPGQPAGAPPQPGGTPTGAPPPQPAAGGGAAGGAGNEMYGGYSVQQLLANPALQQRLGAHAAQRWQQRQAEFSSMPPRYRDAIAKGTMTPAQAAERWRLFQAGQLPGQSGAAGPTPPPDEPTSAPGPPVGGGGGGAPGGAPGGGAGGGQSPWPDYPGAEAGGPMLPGIQNEFEDPMMMFLSAVPGMRMNTQRQIGDAMASAGGTGNRWGTSSQRIAGQIGAESAMQENAMMQQLLSQYANNQENRALQATGQATGLGALQDQLAQSRIQLPFQVGGYEQGRQDNFSNTAFQDWAQNRLGWLGPMLDFAGRQGSGSPGSPGQVLSVPGDAAEPGAADWMQLLAGFFS